MTTSEIIQVFQVIVPPLISWGIYLLNNISNQLRAQSDRLSRLEEYRGCQVARCESHEKELGYHRAQLDHLAASHPSRELES